MLRIFAQNRVREMRLVEREAREIDENPERNLNIDTGDLDDQRLSKHELEKITESTDAAVQEAVQRLGPFHGGSIILRQVDLEKSAALAGVPKRGAEPQVVLGGGGGGETTNEVAAPLVEMTEEERALLETMGLDVDDEDDEEVLIQPSTTRSHNPPGGVKIRDPGPRVLQSCYTFWSMKPKKKKNKKGKSKLSPTTPSSSNGSGLLLKDTSPKTSRGLCASHSFIERAPLPVTIRRYLVMEARSFQIRCRRDRTAPLKLPKPLMATHVKPWRKELPGVNVDATGRPTDHVPGIALGYTFSAKARAQATQEAAAPEKALLASDDSTVIKHHFNKEGRDIQTDEPVPWNVLPRNTDFNRDTTWLRPIYSGNDEEEEEEEQQPKIEELSGTFYGGSTVREKTIPVDKPDYNNPIAPDLEEWANRSVLDSVVGLASRSVLCRELQEMSPHVQFIPLNTNPVIPRTWDSSSSSYKFKNPTKSQLLIGNNKKKRNRASIFVGQAPINKLPEQVAMYQRVIHQLIGRDADILGHRVIERPNPQGANQPPRKHLIFSVPEESWPVMQQCFHNLLLVENGGAWIATSRIGMYSLHDYINQKLRPHTKAMGSGSSELIEAKRLRYIPQGVLTPGNMLLFEAEKDIREGLTCRAEMLGRHSSSAAGVKKANNSKPGEEAAGVVAAPQKPPSASSGAPPASKPTPAAPNLAPSSFNLPSGTSPIPIVGGGQPGPTTMMMGTSTTRSGALSSTAPAWTAAGAKAKFDPSAAKFIPAGAAPTSAGVGNFPGQQPQPAGAAPPPMIPPPMPTAAGVSVGGRGALHKAALRQQQGLTPVGAGDDTTAGPAAVIPAPAPTKLNQNAASWTPGAGFGGGSS